MADRGRPLAVALLSAATLAFEILLVRVFAIEQFHHFAYMAIGVAMLGYGTSGTLLALAPGLTEMRREHAFRAAALATPLALLACTALVHRIPLDPMQLPWDTAQWPRLTLVYVLLALPFATGALAILLALSLDSGRPGRVYGASFLGAGLGSAGALAVLQAAPPDHALAVPALLAAAGAACAVIGAAPLAARTRPARIVGVATRTVAAVSTIVAASGVVVAAAAIARPPWQLRITPYKGLPQVEAYPGARRLGEHASALGWVVAVEAPAFRHAPGLSLAYKGAFPRQTALFVDGVLAGAVAAPGDSAALAILDWLPAAVPWALGPFGRVLVLGAGGGTEVATALAHDATHVRAVELHPEIARLSRADARPEAPQSASTESPLGSLQPRVEWSVADARSWVARTHERFHLITLGAGQAFGTSTAGVHALSEDFLHTTDGYAAYLERLEPDGVLAVTRWLTAPPRAEPRVILTAAEALWRVAPGRAGEQLVVVRSWATATTLVKPSGFSPDDVTRLAAWAESRAFDLDWYPGMTTPASRFNLIDEPVLFRAAEAAATGPDEAARFADAYPFPVEPVGDARPYPHHFLRWRSLGTFLSGGRGSWLPFAEWGWIALLATLAQSTVVAALLLLLPASFRVSSDDAQSNARGRARITGYFAAIGFAYLAAEIAAIQQLNLLLGHPVYAVAAVLTAFLVFSGLGSLTSDRRAPHFSRIAAFGIAGLLILLALALLPIVHGVQPAPLPVRGGAAVVLLAPLAFAMGMPFPLGLRALTHGSAGPTASAWAANGFASAVAAPLAALIALEAGSPALFLAAAAAYAVAGWLAPGR